MLLKILRRSRLEKGRKTEIKNEGREIIKIKKKKKNKETKRNMLTSRQVKLLKLFLNLNKSPV